MVETQEKVRVAIFASGAGSNTEALIHASFRMDSLYSVAVLVSNNSRCGAVELATMFDIPVSHISTQTHPEPDIYAQAFLDTLRRRRVELIVLAGYMKKLPDEVIRKYRDRVFNIHPALLPKYGGTGMFGSHVHEAVLAAGDLETGVTVHKVEGEYDTGEILAQERVPVLPGDTVETLSGRVRLCEHSLYPEVIQSQAELFLQHQSRNSL